MKLSEFPVGTIVVSTDHEFGRGFKYVWEVKKDDKGFYAEGVDRMVGKDGVVRKTHENGDGFKHKAYEFQNKESQYEAL